MSKDLKDSFGDSFGAAKILLRKSHLQKNKSQNDFVLRGDNISLIAICCFQNVALEKILLPQSDRSSLCQRLFHWSSCLTSNFGRIGITTVKKGGANNDRKQKRHQIHACKKKNWMQGTHRSEDLGFH